MSGGEDENGHLEELRVDPIALMNRVRAECGDVGVFRLADRDVVLLTGAEANEFFFRAPEEVLDQAEAYPFMTPIFGEGVVFDAPPERRREMLHNQALRDKFMRGHAATIADEVEQMVAGWDDEGEIDLLDWFAELTIYTSSACLIGKRFRNELDKRFAELYHDLEQGTDAIAYVDPYADIESFRRRDAARVGLVELVEGDHGAAGRRAAAGRRRARPARRADVDHERGRLAALLRRRGHRHVHLDDVRRPPHHLGHGGVDADRAAAPPRRAGRGRRRARRALRRRGRGQLPGPAGDAPPGVGHQGGAAPPPAADPAAAGGQGGPRGRRVHHRGRARWWGPARRCPTGSPRTSPTPTPFQPARYLEPREEDRANPWTWIPFGAGRHRCVGAAFAMMQLKAIFSVLLLDWEFELAQPLGLLPQRPLEDGGPAPAALRGPVPAQGGRPGRRDRLMRVVVDLDLCQGHGVCESRGPRPSSSWPRT